MLDRPLYATPEPLEALLDALTERAKRFTDLLVPAAFVWMDNDGQLVVRNGRYSEHSLQPQALALVARRLRIPCEYLLRCPPDLRAQNVNHWMRTLGSRELLLRLDGNEVRAMLSGSYVPLDNLELLSLLAKSLNGVGQGVRDPHLSVRWEWTATRFVCELLLPEDPRTSARIVGAIVRGGIYLRNSETGFAAVSIRAMLVRLICSNGMVASEDHAFRKVHRTELEVLTDGIRGVLAGLPDRIGVLLSNLQRLEAERIADPDHELETLLEREGMPPIVIEAARRAFSVERGSTTASLVHALSRAANDPSLSLDERERLQLLAGRML